MVSIHESMTRYKSDHITHPIFAHVFDVLPIFGVWIFNEIFRLSVIRNIFPMALPHSAHSIFDLFCTDEINKYC